MTTTQISVTVRRRTKTNTTNFTDANLLIAINNAYERVNALIRKWLDNYRPTLFTTFDSTVPVFDSLFHDLLVLWPSYQYAIENSLSSANGFLQEIVAKEKELEEFYGNRNYQVFTVTIASPGVFTLKNHNLLNDDKVSFVTSGALPTGLSVDTFYYIISAGLDDDNFEVSATRDGTAINTSGTQSGTHYLFSDRRKGLRISAERANENR